MWLCVAIVNSCIIRWNIGKSPNLFWHTKHSIRKIIQQLLLIINLHNIITLCHNILGSLDYFVTFGPYLQDLYHLYHHHLYHHLHPFRSILHVKLFSLCLYSITWHSTQKGLFACTFKYTHSKLLIQSDDMNYAQTGFVILSSTMVSALNTLTFG